MKELLSKELFITAACFYLLSAITLYKGYDKMTNYYSSEYSYSSNVNAYVGGDAYNYIINGNYATGFFVLSMGTLLTGTLFLLTGLVMQKGIVKIEETAVQTAVSSEKSEDSDDYIDQLPEI